jgi:hypothetical protein
MGFIECRLTRQMWRGFLRLEVPVICGVLETSYFHFLAKDAADRLTGNRGAGA